MKKLLHCLIILFFFAAFNSSIFAQDTSLFLALTPYGTREDLDVLFAQGEKILNYYEGENVEEPIFLSVINSKQIDTITDSGLNPQVLDSLESLEDIFNYRLLYHPKPDQSSRLAGFGQVFTVSRHYTILKLSEGTPFSHQGVLAEFFDIPFSDTVVTPKLRTKIAVEPSPTLVTAVSAREMPADKFNLWYLVFSLYLIIYPLGMLLLFNYLDKKNKFDSINKKAGFMILATIFFAVGFFILSTLSQSRQPTDFEYQPDIKVEDIDFF